MLGGEESETRGTVLSLKTQTIRSIESEVGVRKLSPSVKKF
jgi:hypothetical protein